MIVSGDNVSANGTMINDPEKDPSVSPLICDIRRERAVELIYEGFRQDDLRRWKKFGYLKSREETGPTKFGLGAYIDLTALPAGKRAGVEKAVKFCYPDPNNKNRGFIYTLYDANMRMNWQPGNPCYERQYLNAVPLDQMKLCRSRLRLVAEFRLEYGRLTKIRGKIFFIFGFSKEVKSSSEMERLYFYC